MTRKQKLIYKPTKAQLFFSLCQLARKREKDVAHLFATDLLLQYIGDERISAAFKAGNYFARRQGS